MSTAATEVAPARRARLVTDLAEFARLQRASGDIDPAYPVLAAWYAEARLAGERALWRTLVYVAFYNVASMALYVTGRRPPLPTGIERRGLRDVEAMRAHLDVLEACGTRHGSYAGWLGRDLGADPRANWRLVMEHAQEAKFNGRWAAFKLADLLKNVHGWPLEAPDLGMAHSSGPREGLALFFGAVEGHGTEAIARLDAQAEGLRRLLAERHSLDLPLDQLETALCDFHNLVRGRYYVGHDVDEMQGQLLAATRRDPATAEVALAWIWRARAAVLPAALLGEVGGWEGVRTPLQTLYRDTGRLAWWVAPA